MDERQGVTHDFTRKERVHESAIIGTGKSRGEFWNDIERHHKRGDAVTARELEVSLSESLNVKECKALAREVAETISKRYGVVVDYALHTSSLKDIDGHVMKDAKGQTMEHNPHVHYLISAVTVDRETGALGKKVNELDPIHCARAGIENFADVVRPYVANLTNEYLERAQLNERVSHLSYKDQGLDRIPTVHVGPTFDARAEAARQQNVLIWEENARRLREKSQERPEAQKENPRTKEEQVAHFMKTLDRHVELFKEDVRELYQSRGEKVDEKELHRRGEEMRTKLLEGRRVAPETVELGYGRRGDMTKAEWEVALRRSDQRLYDADRDGQVKGVVVSRWEDSTGMPGVTVRKSNGAEVDVKDISDGVKYARVGDRISTDDWGKIRNETERQRDRGMER